VSYNQSVNKSNKGRPQPPGGTLSQEFPPIEQVIPEVELERMSALQLLDIISHKLVVQGATPADVTLLRRRIE